MNDKTIQRLTDIQFYGREETVNPRPHRRSRTCWVTMVWWGGGGGRGQGEGRETAPTLEKPVELRLFSH